ncbi:MAG TPA: phosphate ABC transporter permease subunit PstC [Candidatus Limnocylindrales bacterium]|nr:phosphate ABC transporter permease subunit PstC [Candidatus Limnocylindrales bacterium]
MTRPKTTPGNGFLAGSATRRRRERLVGRIFLASATLTIVISTLIVASLVGGAVEFLGKIDPSQLLADGWYPRRGEFGIVTLVAGTLVVSGIALLVAVPVGLLSAIYLSEYAQARARRTIKPILEVLAGIPSVVLGFFALTFISPTFVQNLNPAAPTFNLFSAGLAVGILSIPLIASVSEDAMRAVPSSLREASYALGARRLTTSLTVVIPAAISGIVAAIIIGVSRTIGETMIVAVAAGGSGGAAFTLNPFDQGQTITAAMAALASGSDQVTGDTAAYQSLFFLGLTLFVITFVLNQAGDLLVRRTRRAY